MGVLARLPGRGMDGVFEDDIPCPSRMVLENTLRLGIFAKAIYHSSMRSLDYPHCCGFNTFCISVSLYLIPMISF